jgi:hypothetical protein
MAARPSFATPFWAQALSVHVSLVWLLGFMGIALLAFSVQAVPVEAFRVKSLSVLVSLLWRLGFLGFPLLSVCSVIIPPVFT